MCFTKKIRVSDKLHSGMSYTLLLAVNVSSVLMSQQCILNKVPLCKETHIPGHISRREENANLKSYMHTNVHSSTIYNSQDMEAT